MHSMVFRPTGLLCIPKISEEELLKSHSVVSLQVPNVDSTYTIEVEAESTEDATPVWRDCDSGADFIGELRPLEDLFIWGGCLAMKVGTDGKGNARTVM